MLTSRVFALTNPYESLLSPSCNWGINLIEGRFLSL
jgi:hypothetical protein